MEEGWRKNKKQHMWKECDRGKQPTEQNFVARERITVWSGTGDQYAADHSKWSLPVVMWADGI